jgi:PAS domain S-box-containing protein
MSRGLLLVGVLIASLLVAQAAGVGLMQDGDAPAGSDPSFFVPLLCGAAAGAAGAFWHRQERLLWALLAVGLALGAAAESSFHLSQEAEGKATAAAVVYGLFCAAAGAVVLTASGDFRFRRAITQGLGVCAFGLATAWAWAFLAPEASSTATVHSALDLLLALAVLAAFCNHGWPVAPRFGMLAAGLGLIALGDAMESHDVLPGVAGLDLADPLPFAGAALIGAVACYGIRLDRRGTRSGRLVVILSLVAVVMAVVTLIYDHYSRLHSGAVLLASLTLLAAGIRLTVAQRGWRDARARVREAEAAGAVGVAALDAVVTVGADGAITGCNERAYRAFRRSEVEIVGKPVGNLLDGGTGNGSFEELLARAEAGTLPATLELNAYDTHGVAFPVEVTIAPARATAGAHTLVVRDISERKRREEENRRLAAIIRSSDDAVLTKDLSGVVTGWNQGAERIYGYSAQEAIGRSVAELLIPPDRRAEAKQILKDVAAGEVISFETQRITKNGALIDVSLRAFPIRGISGGVTAVCAVGHDVSELRRRERAEQHDTEASLWRERLRESLGNGGLLFYGQPILDLRSGDIHHHELLVRMRLNGDVVPPGAFLPYVEESELIRDLDLWAVEKGMALGSQIPVAINLSARSLGSRGLLGAIERGLNGDPSLAARLTFEITETAAAENMQGARELVGELTKMGCGVALDDFGTGYGSFTYLRHLPVTQLKIDMEFIRGLRTDAADRRVVESMIDVAHNFEMTTVAEGVEDAQTLDVLRELDVDLAQGYHVGRPQPLGLGKGEGDG